MEERLPYTQVVTGSSPVSPTNRRDSCLFDNKFGLDRGGFKCYNFDDQVMWASVLSPQTSSPNRSLPDLIVFDGRKPLNGAVFRLDDGRGVW